MPKHFDFCSESSMLSFLNQLDSKKSHSLDEFDDANHLAYTLVNKLKKVSDYVLHLATDARDWAFFPSFCCASTVKRRLDYMK